MSAPPTPGRLEAFSDGVIAVIITIMVLELHVPRADGVAGLRALAPTLGVYLLSFVFTGIYWVNHHHLVDRLHHIDTRILWSNLSLLFTLSLIPFFTNYLAEKHFDGFSVMLYAVCMLLPGIAFQLLSMAIRRNLRRSHAAVTDEDRLQHRRELRKGLVSLADYALAILLSHVHPRIALALVAGVTLIWLTPEFGTRKPESCSAAEQQQLGPNLQPRT